MNSSQLASDIGSISGLSQRLDKLQERLYALDSRRDGISLRVGPSYVSISDKEGVKFGDRTAQLELKTIVASIYRTQGTLERLNRVCEVLIDNEDDPAKKAKLQQALIDGLGDTH